MQAVNFITTRAPKISLSFRQKGTELWPQTEKTPGPGKTKHNSYEKFRVHDNLAKYFFQLDLSIRGLKKTV